MKLFFHKTGNGKPLFILHGLFGMSDNWMTLSKQFAENGFACYTVDLRNHGRSPHSMEFNYQVMADDLLELISDEKITEPVYIISHSMGGKVAMFFASMHPEKTAKLVVVDIAPRYYPPHHDQVLAALHSVNLNDISSRKEAEEQLRISLRDEATIQLLLKNLYWKEEVKNNGNEKKLAWRFNLEAIEKNMDEGGKGLPAGTHIDVPTLFVKGERSGYISAEDEKEIATIFSNAQIKTVAAGHWVHAENPEGFMDVVLEFLVS